MPTTARGIWTPSDTDAVDFTADLATMAGTVDTAIDNVANSIGLGANAFKGTAAQRTAFTSTAVNGMLWQDTDSIKMIWRKDGAAWVPAAWRWSGTTSQMNAFTQAPNGFEWFNTTDNSDYVRSSAAWIKTSRVETLTLIRGVPASGYAGPSVSVADGIATIVGRIGNGSGLTLTGSFQQVAALPAWALPTGAIIAPATATGTTVNALVRLTSDGQVAAASSGSIVTFAFSYPVA